jgi:hypothetical protein
VQYFFTFGFSILAIFSLTSCVYLHHVQISDIDQRRLKQLEKFEIMVSETGVNLDEATSIARGLTSSKKTREQLDQINSLISLFQMGPRTGNLVFNDTYAEPILELILSRCPSGQITGLTSLREMKKYPVISGEIVKITGWCQS